MTPSKTLRIDIPALQAGLDALPAAVYGRYSANPNGTIDSVGNQHEGGGHYCDGVWPARPLLHYGDDGISASHEDVERPGFNQMRADIRAGRVGAVIVKNQSRLVRNEVEWTRLRRECLAAGIEVWHCWGKGGIVDIGRGRAIKAKIDLAIDSDYGETVSVNVRRAQESLARKGKSNGGVCFGYIRGPRPAKGGTSFVPDPEVAGIPQEIFDRVLAGEAINAVAADLTERGVPTVRGRALWRPSTVRALLGAPTVTALRVYQGEVVGEGDWDPVVDRDTWHAMETFLVTPRHVETKDGRRVVITRRGAVQSRYLMSGIASCPHCGNTLSGSVRKGRSSYLCPTSRGGCDRTSAIVEGVDNEVVRQLMEKLSEPKFRKLLTAKDPNVKQRKRLVAELADIEERRKADAQDFNAKLMSRKTWLAAAAALDDDETVARTALNSLPEPVGDIDPDEIIAGWEMLPLDRRQHVLRRLIESAVIQPSYRSTGNRFDPGRVDVTWRRLP